MAANKTTLAPGTERLITIRELAEYFGIHGSTAYRLVRDDAIPYARIGGGSGGIRFRLSKVIEHLEKEHHSAR